MPPRNSRRTRLDSTNITSLMKKITLIPEDPHQKDGETVVNIYNRHHIQILIKQVNKF
jgi:hypothetical protein